jgi:hypothetical protein
VHQQRLLCGANRKYVINTHQWLAWLEKKASALLEQRLGLMMLSQMELDMTKANYATKVKFKLLVATTPSLQGKFVFAFHEE